MNIFLPKTSFPCYLTSHDEDQTPGVSDDGGENRGKRREGVGGHGVSLQAFEKIRSGKENERKRKELGLFSQHPRAPFRVCVRSCTFRKGRAAGGRRPNNCTNSLLRIKRECRRKTPLNLLGLGRLGSYFLGRTLPQALEKAQFAEGNGRKRKGLEGPLEALGSDWKERRPGSEDLGREWKASNARLVARGETIGPSGGFELGGSALARKWRRKGLKRLNSRPEMVWPRQPWTPKMWDSQDVGFR